MSKICSLDFLSKEKFDLDIISAGGKLLFSKGDKVTPEILLSLYFKEVSAREHIKTPEEIEIENQNLKKNKLTLEESLSNFEKALEPILANALPMTLDFDKSQAHRITKLSNDLGMKIGMSDENMEELKQAAYYYQVGRIKLTQDDLLDPSFEKKQAEIGYDMLTLEMNMPKQIAEVTKTYSMKYNCIEYDLNSKDPSDIPYAHIVGLVDYYDRLINNALVSNEEALKKMLKVGGDKFNIFLLHRFVNIMKDSNG